MLGQPCLLNLLSSILDQISSVAERLSLVKMRPDATDGHAHNTIINWQFIFIVISILIIICAPDKFAFSSCYDIILNLGSAYYFLAKLKIFTVSVMIMWNI